MTVDEWKKSVSSIIGNATTEAIEKFATDINDETASVLDLVEALGPKMTGSDAVVRQNAILVLVSVLEKLPSTKLSAKEIAVLLEFLLSKLDDHQLIAGLAFRGIVALANAENFTLDSALTVLDRLDDMSKVSVHTRDRHKIYEYFGILSERFEEGMRALEPGLLPRLLNFIGEETDPNNLWSGFHVLLPIMRKFDIGALAETAFEVISSYFPIDFVPSKKEDMESDLKERLVESLRACLTVTPLFVEPLIPLILEKLSSDSVEAKLEALRCLKACCENLQPKEILSKNVLDLWAPLRKEIVTSSTDSVEEAAVDALKALSRVILSDTENDGPAADSFIKMVVADTEQFLRKPDMQLQYSAGQIFAAVMAASPYACVRIFKMVIPLSINLYTEQLRTDDRLAMLRVMLLLLHTTAAVSKEHRLYLGDSSSISAFLQSLLMENRNSSISSYAVMGLTALIGIQTSKGLFVDDDRVLTLCRIMIGSVMDYENSGLVDQTVLFFDAVGRDRSTTLIYRKIVPEAIKQIRGHEIIPIPVRLVNLTKALIRVPRSNRIPDFIAELLVRVEDLDKNGPYVPTMQMYLEIIATYVEQTRSTTEAEKLHEIVVLPSVRKAILAAVGEDVSGFQDIAILLALSRIYREIACRMSDASYRAFVRQLGGMYSEAGTAYRDFTGSGDRLIPVSFKPIDKPYITTHTRCISLLTSIVCSAPKTYKFDHVAWQSVFQRLMETCCLCSDEQSSVFAAQCMAGIVNRQENERDVQTLLDDVLKNPSSARARSQERRYTRILGWVTKALVLHPDYDQFALPIVDTLILRLKSQKSSEEAADAFRVVMEESQFVLNARINAVVSPVYRQKFFNAVLPLLMRSYEELKEDDPAWSRKAHLVALSNLLKFCPSAVSRAVMPKVFPFMLQSLKANDPELSLFALSTFDDVLAEADPSRPPPFDTQLIPPLIESLLDIAVPANTPMGVKIAAIKCLQHTAEHIMPAPLQPYKQKVLKQLGRCLDDKKRLVREVAVSSRGSWFVVGG